LKLGRAETVRRLIAGESLTDQKEELLAFEAVLADGKPLNADQIAGQQTYWLYRMANTQAPLIEKMTLFWHGHFATSFQKVRSVPLMMQQNALFRKYAVGSFHELVVLVGKDPAMMIYLDANSNRKDKPNENYGREVMELFTLGEGNYSEEDVKAAAKSFTGWSVHKDTGEVVFHPNQHDQSIKTVLDQTGNFNAADLVNVLFKQKALASFMAKKLLRFFCIGTPDQAWIDQVAADFSQKKTVGEVLSDIFQSDRFYAPENQLALIKSPAEYVVGIIRAFQLPLSNSYASAMRKMGQELYLPPNVSGWPGGNTWLISSSLLGRYQFAESVAKKVKIASFTSADFTPPTRSKEANMPVSMTEANDWVSLWARNLSLATLGKLSSSILIQYANDTFVHAQQQNAGKRGLLQLLMISPEAQMK